MDQDKDDILNMLLSIKVYNNLNIKRLKDIQPTTGGREKAIAITKLEEAGHRIVEIIELVKQIK